MINFGRVANNFLVLVIVGGFFYMIFQKLKGNRFKGGISNLFKGDKE